MPDRIDVDAADLANADADWASKAASFVVAPPAATGTSSSAAAVAAIHGLTAQSHAAFGQRLAAISARVDTAANSYVATDEQNAALASYVGHQT